MSGGHYNYTYSRIRDEYVGHMKDPELDALMKDISDLVYELEWTDSGDTGIEVYFEAVKKFKTKWFKKSRKEQLEEIVKKELEKTERKLKIMITSEVNDEDEELF